MKKKYNIEFIIVNSKTTTFIRKISYSAFFLVLATTLSLLEWPPVYLPPYGLQFSFRLFDTLALFFALRIIGLKYTLLVGSCLPWFHVMIDGKHSPISMVGFMVSNILCILIFYFLYYKIYNFRFSTSEYLKHRKLHNNHPLHYDHNHSKVNEKKQNKIWKKEFLISKFLCILLICLCCALIETSSYFAIDQFLAITLDPNSSENIAFSNHRNHFSEGLILASVIFSILLAKYIVTFLIFLKSENAFRHIARRHGLF